MEARFVMLTDKDGEHFILQTSVIMKVKKDKQYSALITKNESVPVFIVGEDGYLKKKGMYTLTHIQVKESVQEVFEQLSLAVG